MSSDRNAAHGQPIRYVDPLASHGRIHRALLRLFSSRLMFWFEHTLLWRIAGWRLVPRMMRLTRQRTVRLPVPAGLLETKDTRNGRPHRRAVIYFHDGDNVTIIPTKAGLPDDPFWYQNILADPDVIFAGEPLRAHVIKTDEELARLWELADRFFPPYAAYRAAAARSGRTIPVLQLAPH